MSINPYQPPAENCQIWSEIELHRLAYRQHECWLRMFGYYYFFTSQILAALSGLCALLGFLAVFAEGYFALQMLIPALVISGASYLGVYSGGALADLELPKYRMILICTSIWIFVFPIATVSNGVLLWLLLSRKGRYIFTDHYADCIAQTPKLTISFDRTGMLIGAVIAIAPWVFIAVEIMRMRR